MAMALNNTGNHARSIGARFGLTRDHRPPNSPPRVNEGATAWEIYNNRAATIDKELIKDWSDSLNTLLIFGALYSAVLTAFIIESMKLLREDPTETARDILLLISQQLANNSVEAFKPESFKVDDFAVRVNYCFFISISSSLMAALGAVLALQWVGSYDAGLNQSSPEGRALQRHFRYQGIEAWKMAQIIAFLPALIFIALFLFFVGLADWMWHLHQGIAGIVIFGLICGAIFFSVTTAISMIYVEAPFRTPASRSLPRLFTRFYCAFVALVLHSSPLKSRNPPESNSIDSFEDKPPESLSLAHRSITEILSDVARRFQSWIIHVGIYMLQFWERCQALLLPLRSFGHYLKSPRPIEPFDSRETVHVQGIIEMKPTALLWLLNSVDVLPHNAGHFRSIIREVLLLPPLQLIDSTTEGAPWGSIFKLLLGPYLERTKEDGISEEETEELGPTMQALSLVWRIPPSNHVFHLFLRAARDKSTSLTRCHAQIAFNRTHENEHSDSLAIQLFFVILAARSSPVHLTEAHLLRIRMLQEQNGNQWSYGLDFVFEVFDDGYKDLSYPLAFDLTNTNSFCIPDHLIDLVYDIFALRYLNNREAEGETPFKRYCSSFEVILKEGDDRREVRVAKLIHDALITQVLGRSLQRFGRSEDHKPTMAKLDRLLQASASSGTQTAIITAVFQISEDYTQRSWFSLWKQDPVMMARIYARILPGSYTFTGDDWGEWRTRFYLGLQALLKTKEWASAESKQLVWKQARDENLLYRQPVLSPPQVHRLWAVTDPKLLLYLSAGLNSLWVYPPYLRIAIESSGEEALNLAISHWKDLKGNHLELHSSEVDVLRAIVSRRGDSMGSVQYRLSRIQAIEDSEISSEDWYCLLRRPILGLFLQPGSWYRGCTMDILKRVCKHHWFFAEFTAAGGFSWIVESEAIWLKEGAEFVCLSLEHGGSEEEILQWIGCLHLSLVSPRSPPADWEEIYDPCPLYMAVITKIYLAQGRQRTGVSPPLPQTDTSISPMANGADGSRREEDDSRHSYVRTWSEDKWKQWQDMREEIIDGLRRGFIRLGPSASTACFLRDPDGYCSHLCED